MMNILLVAFGGALGSTARFYSGRMIIKKMGQYWPWATFTINLMGSFLLGIIIGLQLDIIGYHFIAVGFLGAFTTFSTFMYEGMTLIKNKRRIAAFSYTILSLILGMASCLAGMLFISGGL